MSRAHIAVHEAGHVLFAAASGLPIKYATIVPDRDSGGHVAHGAYRGVWDGVVMAVAGCAAAAAMLRTGHRPAVAKAEELLMAQAGGDLSVALHYAAAWADDHDLPEEAVWMAVSGALSLAVALLRRRSWAAALDRVAAGLMEHRTLSGAALLRRVGGLRIRRADSWADDVMSAATRRVL